jgi:hypothetical protein
MAYGTQWSWDNPLASVVDAFKRSRQGDVLYRFDAVSYSYCADPDLEEYRSTGPKLELTCYDVRRWTPTGATLQVMSGAKHKHVNLMCAKRFACRTPQEALESYRARKRKAVRIYDARAENARRELALAEIIHSSHERRTNSDA